MHISKRLFKKTRTIVLAALFLIAMPLTVFAGSNDSIFVGADEIIDGNFIKAGNVIDINGAINGDLILAGNSVTISGPVAGDVIVAANTVRILGTVGGSIRAVGNSIDIDSEVAHNVWAAGGTVALGVDSLVGWDVYAAAGSVEVKGPVEGNLWVGAGGLVINSEIGKDVTAGMDDEGQVILNSTANIAGNLTYHAKNSEQLIISEGALITGETLLRPIAVASSEVSGLKDMLAPAILMLKIVIFFSLLVVGLLLISTVPKFILKVNDEMMASAGKSIGRGVIYFFLAPIVIFLLFLTVIGIPLGFIALPLYIIALYVSKIIAGLVLGIWLVDKMSRDKVRKSSLVMPLIIGLLIIIVISSLPVIGWFVGMVLTWWALGAFIKIKNQELKEYK